MKYLFCKHYQKLVVICKLTSTGSLQVAIENIIKCYLRLTNCINHKCRGLATFCSESASIILFYADYQNLQFGTRSDREIFTLELMD